MYIKAYNVWKKGNKDATKLVCKVERANGYSVGANGIYDNNGWDTNDNTIEAGPNNIFMTAGGNHWWLASPSAISNDYLLQIAGDRASVYVSGYSDKSRGLCPIVSLK